MDAPTAPITPPANKKAVIAAIAVIGIVVLFIFITIFTGVLTGSEKASPNQEQPVTGNTQPTNSENTANSLPSADPEQADDWKVYQNSQYSIKYPQDWVAQEMNLSGRASGISIKPVSEVGRSSNINFTVTVDDGSSVDEFRQKQQMYSQLGFKSGSMVVDTTQATRLSGTIPQRSAKVPSNAKLLQTTYVYLEKGNNGYFLDYSYLNVGPDIELENIFNKMVASFRFAQ